MLYYIYRLQPFFHKSKYEIDREIKAKCKNVITLSLTVHYNIKVREKKWFEKRNRYAYIIGKFAPYISLCLHMYSHLIQKKRYEKKGIEETNHDKFIKKNQLKLLPINRHDIR